MIVKNGLIQYKYVQTENLISIYTDPDFKTWINKNIKSLKEIFPFEQKTMYLNKSKIVCST